MTKNPLDLRMNDYFILNKARNHVHCVACHLVPSFSPRDRMDRGDGERGTIDTTVKRVHTVSTLHNAHPEHLRGTSMRIIIIIIIIMNNSVDYFK